jgi:D-alanyl-D-alanine-carboxypeptidase/D-alanyl-D-alanine-endopeptidase
MNEQELKDLWQKQKLEAAPLVDARAQIEAMRTKMSELHATLNARNVGELATCGFVIIVFGVYFFIFPYPVTRLGDLIVIGGCLLASWKFIESRRRAPRPDAAAPMAHWLKQERERVHHEAELLRTVLWWYILPIGLGTNVFFWGLPKLPWAAKIGFTGVATLIYVWIYRRNQTARRKKLLPVQDELEALLQQESQTGTAEKHPPAASAQKRSNTVWIVLALVIALFAVLPGAWNTFKDRGAESPLHAPGFDDVSSFNNDDIARVDEWLQEQVALAKYPSLSVAIVRDGKVVYQRAFGFEDIKARRKATPETSYHVASVTKAFTASLAVMLHARGVVDLDQPVAKYLPRDVSISTKPEVGATITLRQLASHTSGLPRGVPGPVQSVEGRYELEPKRLYAHLARVKLEFDPGTDELYSNLGFGLLGHALERAAGKPFDRLLREMLCDPLQLERTAINVNDKLRLATGYSSSSRRREEEHSYRERFASSGGLIASAPDLAQFLAAQMKPGLFSSEMLAQLHTESRLLGGSKARTSLGWSVRSRGSVGRILEKNGGRNNCSAWIGFVPDHGVGVVVVTNCGGPDVDPIGHWLLERFVSGGRKPVPLTQ